MQPYLHFAGVGLAGAARSGPGALDAGGAAAGLRAAPGAGAGRGHRLARGDRGEPVDRAAVLDLQARLVAGHFDHAFYRARYGLSAEADAVRDYCDTGWRQGRNPRPDFNGGPIRRASSRRARDRHRALRPLPRHGAAARHRHLGRRPSIRATARRRSERMRTLVEQARLIEPYFDAALVPEALPRRRAASRTARHPLSSPRPAGGPRPEQDLLDPRSTPEPTGTCSRRGSRRSCTTCARAGPPG